VKKKTLGGEHSDTVTAIEALANSYNNGGRTQDTIKLREKVLQVKKKTLGGEHSDTVTVIEALANSYDSVSRTQDAIK
jgi:hypothetical protein